MSVSHAAILNNYSKYTANFVNNYAHINAPPENNVENKKKGNNVKKSQMRQKHIKVCEFLYTEVH